MDSLRAKMVREGVSEYLRVMGKSSDYVDEQIIEGLCAMDASQYMMFHRQIDSMLRSDIPVDVRARYKKILHEVDMLRG